MTAVACVLAAFLALTLGLVAILCAGRDQIAAERDAAVAERNDLDALLRVLLAERPSATVLPLRRIPGQRNGEGA